MIDIQIFCNDSRKQHNLDNLLSWQKNNKVITKNYLPLTATCFWMKTFFILLSFDNLHSRASLSHSGTYIIHIRLNHAAVYHREIVTLF